MQTPNLGRSGTLRLPCCARCLRALPCTSSLFRWPTEPCPPTLPTALLLPPMRLLYALLPTLTAAVSAGATITAAAAARPTRLGWKEMRSDGTARGARKERSGAAAEYTPLPTAVARLDAPRLSEQPEKRRGRLRGAWSRYVLLRDEWSMDELRNATRLRTARQWTWEERTPGTARTIILSSCFVLLAAIPAILSNPAVLPKILELAALSREGINPFDLWQETGINPFAL